MSGDAGGGIGFSFTPAALAFLKSIQPKVRRQIMGKIDALAKEPLPHNRKLVRGAESEEEVWRYVPGTIEFFTS